MVESKPTNQSEQPARGNEPEAPNQAPFVEDAVASSKSTKSPAFQFYPRDFLSSSNVDEMSMTERGIYITLLSRCWLDNGLPTDLRELAKKARMKLQQFERLWTSSPLHKCFTERGGKLHNDRLDHERKVQAAFKAKQSENGSKGGRPKKPVASSGFPVGLQNETQPEPKKSSASASAFSSASAPAGQSVPLIARRRLDAVFEGPRVYVLTKTHQAFLGFRNHAAADAELMAWYERVSDEWTNGAKKDLSTGADMFKFWQARFDEQWPATKPITSRKPAWAQGL